jgi:hypothetical protein
MHSFEEIVDLYKSGKSIPEVSEITGKSQSTVRYHAKKAGVLRSRGDGVRNAASKGLLSHMLGKTRVFTEQWKENISIAKLKHGEEFAKGETVKQKGYIEITRGPNKGKLKHVVIMEERLGRPLKDDECVHHIDEDKQNNEENNLALMTKSGHGRHHQMLNKLNGKSRERNEDGTWC